MKKIMIFLCFLFCLTGCKSKENILSLKEYNKKVDVDNFECNTEYYLSGFGGFSTHNFAVNKAYQSEKSIYFPFNIVVDETEYLLTAINVGAFINDENLEEIHFYDFRNDPKYKEIIPTTIQSYAFYNCKNLSKIENAYFSNVLEYAFYNTSLDMDEIIVSKVDNYAFANINGNINKIKINSTYGRCYVGSYAFKNSDIKEIVLGKEIQFICENAFTGIEKNCIVRYEGTKEEFINAVNKFIDEDNYNIANIGIDKIYTKDGYVSIKEDVLKNSELSCEYNNVVYQYVDGYYCVKQIKNTEEVIEIEAKFNDQIHGEYPVKVINSNAVVGKYNEIILPQSITKLEPFAFNKAEVKLINLDFINYVSDYAFNNSKFECPLFLSNLDYAEDYAFLDFVGVVSVKPVVKNENIFYIGGNAIPKIAINALPTNVILFEDFIGRITAQSQTFYDKNAYHNTDIKIENINYLGDKDLFLKNCYNIFATLNFVDCVFNYVIE